MDTLSESDGSLSLSIYSEDGDINLTMKSLVVQGRQSCVEGIVLNNMCMCKRKGPLAIFCRMRVFGIVR